MPVVVLALDYYIGPEMSLLYVLAGRLYLPRLGFLYLVATAAVVALSAWQLLHRPSRPALAAVASGALLAGGITAVALTILAAWRMSVVFPIWVVPAWAAGIWLKAALRSFQAACRAFGALGAVAVCACSATVTLVVPILLVPQPWNLVSHLPDATGAQLAGADLSGIYLDGCSEVTLAGADLSRANLNESVMGKCGLDLSGANLREAKFRNASLSGINLTGADLRNADLTGAVLFMADLTNADLRMATLGLRAHGRLTLSGTDIRGADLSELEYSEHSVHWPWRGVIYDNTTKWPPGFDPNVLAKPREGN